MCKRLFDGGVGAIALSMGSGGALFLSGDEKFYAPAISVEAKSTVGAGDAMVGALSYAYDNGMDFKSAAKLAIAASAGAVMTEGTKPPDINTVRELLRQVKLVGADA